MRTLGAVVRQGARWARRLHNARRMTLRTFVYVCAAAAAFVPPVAARGQDPQTLRVQLDAPTSAIVGAPVAISCAATDADGISRVTLRVNAPDGGRAALGATFGGAALEVQWAPAVPGVHVLRCRAKGQSSEDAEDTAVRSVTVVAGAAIVETPVEKVGEDEVATSAFPDAAPALGSVVHAGELKAVMRGPRRIAATPEGEIFVVDREGRLFRLTRRGEVVGVVLEGAVSVAAGTDLVFAALKGGAIVGFRPLSGRVVTRFDLEVSEVPAGLAYDEARELLWLAYGSGVVQVRRPDGELVRQIAATPAGQMVRIVDVALSPSGLAWVAQDRSEATGYLHAFNAETGAFVRSIASAAAGQARVIGGLAAAWGRLYVADLFSGNVRVLSEGGASLEVLGKKGFGAGELALPAGVAFMVNGDVLVANMDGNRVERFGSGADLPVCAGDLDCDGMSDAWELANGSDSANPGDAFVDADGDGLNAAEEYAYGSNPHARDSDGDGYADADEVLAGYDPADGEDHNPVMVVDVPSVVDPGVVRLVANIKDRGQLGGCAAAWTQVSGPAVAFDAKAVSPSFIARRGVYRFEAVATCSGAVSRPAPITVAIRNIPARVDVPRVVAVDEKGRVNLTAKYSSDVNADVLKFQWDQVLGRPVTGSKPSHMLTTDLQGAGLYAFQATADDGWGAPASADVFVVALGAAGAPTVVTPPSIVAQQGEQVVLDASASYRSATAEFIWEQVAGPAVELVGVGDAVAFVPPKAGRYAFQVSIVDGAMRSPAAEVTVYASSKSGKLPVADAAAPKVVAVNQPVSLSGAGSRGEGALNFAWRQTRGPAAGLTETDRESATVVAFSPGSYEFELTVDDGISVSLPARVAFEARAAGRTNPVAVASGPAAALVGDKVVLSGAASVGATEWRWTQVEGPWVAVRSGVTTSFRAHAPGVYGFELEVDDGEVRSAPARVNVIVIGK